jgi:hypothetical protein
MAKQSLLFSMGFALVISVTSHVEWKMKVDQMVQAKSVIPFEEYTIFENSMREYLMQSLSDKFQINTVSIDSQSLMDFSALKLIFILGIETISIDEKSQKLLTQQVNQALMSSEWNIFLVREFELGIILSVNAYDMTNVQASTQTKDVFDQVKLEDNSESTPSNVLNETSPMISTSPSTLARYYPSHSIQPSPIISVYPTSNPSSSAYPSVIKPSENYLLDASPNPSTVLSDLSTSLPSPTFSIQPPTKPYISDITPESNPTNALNYKEFHSKIALDLHGLLNILSVGETIILEATVESFIVNYFPSTMDLVFEVRGVKLQKQSIERSMVVTDDAERFLLVELEIYGQGWSINTNALEEFSLDTSINYLFSSQNSAFLDRLIQVGGVFRHIVVSDMQSTVPDNTGNNQTLIIIISVATGLLFLCFVFIFFIHQHFRNGKDLVETDEGDLEIDSLSVSHLESLNNDNRSRKFPVQHIRDGTSKFSIGSPSLASYSDLENWSVTSVSFPV